MKKSAVFSSDRTYRYILWRIWDEDMPYAMFVGLNPSTADEKKDDPTVRRCIGYAQYWKYGALCMTNLFAFRVTDPKILKSVKEPIGKDNDMWLKRLSKKAGIVIAAWGVNGGYMGRDKFVLRLLDNTYCLQTTKDGFPSHPLYLKKSICPKKLVANIMKGGE